MGFEDAALDRLKRYRREADETLKKTREIEEISGEFAHRLFDGLERVAALARKADFEVFVERGENRVSLDLRAGEGAASAAVFALLPGAAAETDEDLMHEELSRYTLDPSGYSGRILGWSSGVEESPCQTFAVYRDGVWKTSGLLVERSRGRVEDPEEVLDGFCLRILGRIVDLASPTSGSGRVWNTDSYTLFDYEEGSPPPTRTRWLK